VGLTPEDNRSPAAEVAPEPPVAPDSAVEEGVEARQGKALGVFLVNARHLLGAPRQSFAGSEGICFVLGLKTSMNIL